jgi:NRPS condensation-like uncharacterized protein
MFIMLLQHRNRDMTLETDISLSNIYSRIQEQRAESPSTLTIEKYKDALTPRTKLKHVLCMYFPGNWPCMWDTVMHSQFPTFTER